MKTQGRRFPCHDWRVQWVFRITLRSVGIAGTETSGRDRPALAWVRIYSESLLNLQQLDPFTVHVYSDGAAPRLLHIPANGPDSVLIRAGSPQQVQERAVPRDPDVRTDHGPGILRETLHGPGGVAMHEVHPDAHREKASRDSHTRCNH
jgi:hypothetical protein